MPPTTAIVIPNTAKIITLINQAVIAFAKKISEAFYLVNIDSQTMNFHLVKIDIVAMTLLPLKITMHKHQYKSC